MRHSSQCGRPTSRTTSDRRTSGRLRTILISASCVASSASRVGPGDPPGHRVDPVVVATQQLVEREPVTGSRSCDQLVVVGLDCDAASVTNPARSAGQVGPLLRGGRGSSRSSSASSSMVPRYGLSFAAAVVGTDLVEQDQHVTSREPARIDGDRGRVGPERSVERLAPVVDGRRSGVAVPLVELDLIRHRADVEREALCRAGGRS